jgi:cell wall-associated NlpC family hydrolase
MTLGQKAAVAAAVAVVASGVSGAASATVHHHHGSGHPAGTSKAAAQAIAYARAQLGKPYCWAGTGSCPNPPYTGFDCSGLASTAWRHAGVTIPRTSQEQWAGLHHVSKPAPGDLVFSYWTDPADPARPNHVQIYIGHGDVIGADTTDVERVPLSTDAGHIVGYARPGAR